MKVNTPYSDQSLLSRLRYALIRLLAGHATVVLNVSIDMVAEPDKGVAVHVEDTTKGAYIDKVSFLSHSLPEGHRLRFRPWQEPC